LGDASFYIKFFIVLSLQFEHSSTMTTCQVGSIYNYTTLQRCQIWPVYFQDTLDKVHQLKFFELQLNTDYSWSPLKYQNVALSAKFWYLEALQLHIGIFKKWPTLATLQHWGRGLIHWFYVSSSYRISGCSNAPFSILQLCWGGVETAGRPKGGGTLEARHELAYHMLAWHRGIPSADNVGGGLEIASKH